jgi:hypothetical protein
MRKTAELFFPQLIKKTFRVGDRSVNCLEPFAGAGDFGDWPRQPSLQAMSLRKTQPVTVSGALRAQIVKLLVEELGYEPALAKRLVRRHEGLMLKAIGGEPPVGPIAFAIHLAHQREIQPAA